MKNEVFTLVPADPALAEAVLRYYLRNRDFLAPFEPVRTPEFYTRTSQRELLALEKAAWAERRGYRFYLMRQGEVIGAIGLNNVIWGAFRSAHLGYKLDKHFLNRGYMTMAVDMVTKFAFEELNLHRIEANVMPRNHASLRVLEKNAYENEGLSRAYLNINGRWEDHIHMVKLNSGREEDDC